jgi:hypothetical protein
MLTAAVTPSIARHFGRAPKKPTRTERKVIKKEKVAAKAAAAADEKPHRDPARVTLPSEEVGATNVSPESEEGVNASETTDAAPAETTADDKGLKDVHAAETTTAEKR